MNISDFLLAKKQLYTVLILTLIVLLLPFTAMQFTREVYWTIGDFIVAGMLIFSGGYLYKLITKTSHNKIINVLVGLMMLCVLSLVWLNLI